MTTLKTDFPGLLSSMTTSQSWLHRKIATLKEYLSSSMKFQPKGDNGLGSALETREKVMQTIAFMQNAILNLQKTPEIQHHTWLIDGLQLQYEGYSQHLQALELMSEAWKDHDEQAVRQIIVLIIDALKLIAQGQEQIIYGLELMQFEPEQAFMN